MAERRMFAKTIVLSDAFLDMPLGARCLYMTMGMLADDDGFVNAPKSIMRQCGSTEDDLKVLIAKKFVIPFETGVIVIKHWRINNYLQRDRLTPTKYQEELAMLDIEDNGTYTQSCIHDSSVPCIHSIDKNSIDKSSIDKSSVGAETRKRKKRFVPPTLDDIKAYCNEKGYNIDCQFFYDYYNSADWKDKNGDPVKSWKQRIVTWSKRDDQRRNSGNAEKGSSKWNIHYAN